MYEELQNCSDSKQQNDTLLHKLKIEYCQCCEGLEEMQEELARKGERVQVYEAELRDVCQQMAQKDQRIEELRKRSYD